jgi:hypothetical protein
VSAPDASVSIPAGAPPRAVPSIGARLLGRTFVHPVFDYAIIGGGLSLLVSAFLLAAPKGDLLVSSAAMSYLLLLCTSAHFAASTVRLYTKPGAAAGMPILSKWVPWIALAFLAGILFLGGTAGKAIDTLYLAWSPYHYSAQAYGLAVVYSYRSGCRLGAADKKWLYWIAMVPFFFMLLHLTETRLPAFTGLDAASIAAWTVPARSALRVAGWIAPVALYAFVWRRASGPMPLIALMTLVSNAVWFFLLDPIDAFLWATIFHGLQYMAIVMIFDAKDQAGRAGKAGGPLFAAAWFYGASLILGYVLFVMLPLAGKWAGFEYYDARLAVVALVNIHHFIVDAYIWRLGRGDSNRSIVGGVA